MGFRRWVETLLIVLLWGSIRAAGHEAGSAPHFTVLVHNHADISQAVLEQAEAEAARVFRAAGIEIVWVDCGTDFGADDPCHDVFRSTYFVLNIVRNGITPSDFVFGLSFLDESGTGKYSDVFFDRIEEAHRESGANVSRLLGMVAAHELGHLLLGARAHSYAGIMTAHWKKEDVRHLGMGTLLFTHDQALVMKARVQEYPPRLARWELREGK